LILPESTCPRRQRRRCVSLTVDGHLRGDRAAACRAIIDTDEPGAKDAATIFPVLAKRKTDTGRIRVYVRDDKPFGLRSGEPI
jgi:hypothetical protein